jgi:hypothetical protein
MGIHIDFGRASAQVALILALAGCSWSSTWQEPRDSRDLLTDLSDDGSLARGLSHPDPSVRRLAARALGRLPADNNVGLVLSAANTEADADTLVEICFTLGQWQATQARALLLLGPGYVRSTSDIISVFVLKLVAD